MPLLGFTKRATVSTVVHTIDFCDENSFKDITCLLILCHYHNADTRAKHTMSLVGNLHLLQVAQESANIETQQQQSGVSASAVAVLKMTS